MKPAQAWLGAGRAVWAGPRDGRSKGSADAPGKVRRRPDVWLNALPMVVGARRVKKRQLGKLCGFQLPVRRKKGGGDRRQGCTGPRKDFVEDDNADEDGKRASRQHHATVNFS